MGKIREIKGNDYVESTLRDNQICIEDMEAILNFLKSHKNVYLYGNGKCGTGFMEYCKTSNFSNVKGYITSENSESFLDKYKHGEDGVILTLKSDYYPEIMPILWGRMDSSDILFLRENTKNIFIRTFSWEYLSDHMWITLPLAKHCNVNCASCSMFSPICEKEFYTLEDIKQDIFHMKRIQLKMNRINISGGEPLLNPEFVKIVEAIREAYPKIPINIYTNALLANRFSEEELERISNISAEFMITDYELDKERLEKVYEVFDSFGIQYQVNHDGDGKVYFKKTIDFEKKVPAYEYINCQHYTFAFSVFIFKGIIYKCPLALSTKSINKYFKRMLELTDKDYLKISDMENQSQIYEFIRSRHPMCSYCPRVSETITWHRSERKIEEWT